MSWQGLRAGVCWGVTNQMLADRKSHMHRKSGANRGRMSKRCRAARHGVQVNEQC